MPKRAPNPPVVVESLVDCPDSLVDCPEEDLIHIVRNMVPHMEDHLEVRSAISEFLTKKILPPLERKFTTNI